MKTKRNGSDWNIDTGSYLSAPRRVADLGDGVFAVGNRHYKVEKFSGGNSYATHRSGVIITPLFEEDVPHRNPRWGKLTSTEFTAVCNDRYDSYFGFNTGVDIETEVGEFDMKLFG